MERYERIATITPHVAVCDAPVVLEKGAILWDAARKATVLQVRFKNTSGKRIRSVYVTCRATDSDNADIAADGLGEFGYVGINCEPKACFGDNIPIVIKSDTVSNVDVRVTRVVYADNSTEDIPYDSYHDLPEQEKLTYENEVLDLYKDLCDIHVEDIKRPIKAADYVRCGCGYVTAQQTCPVCGANIEKLLFYAEESNISEYIRNQKAEEAARREAEIAAKKAYDKKQRRKFARIAACLAGVVMIILSAVVIRNAIITAPSKKQHKRVLEIQEICNTKGSKAAVNEVLADGKKWLDKNTSLDDGMTYVEEFESLKAQEGYFLPEIGPVMCGERVLTGESEYRVISYSEMLLNLYWKNKYRTTEETFLSNVLRLENYGNEDFYALLTMENRTAHTSRVYTRPAEEDFNQLLYIRNKKTSMLIPVYGFYGGVIIYGESNGKLYLHAGDCDRAIICNIETGEMEITKWNEDMKSECIPADLLAVDGYEYMRVRNLRATVFRNRADYLTETRSDDDYSIVNIFLYPMIKDNQLYLPVVAEYKDAEEREYARFYVLSKSLGTETWNIYATADMHEGYVSNVVEELHLYE